MRPRPFAALVASVVASTACGGDLQLPSPPVDEDRTPAIAAMSPLTRWGGEKLELTGVNLGQPGERVRVVFTGGAEAGADQFGTGESLTVEVPAEAADGPVRVITSFGQADSTESLEFLGPDRLLSGAVAGSLDLRLIVQRVFEVGAMGEVAVAHAEGGLRQQPGGGSLDYPRVVAMLPGDRPVSVERAPEPCGGAAVLVRSADLSVIERSACLGPSAGAPQGVRVARSPDGRWGVAQGHLAGLWLLDFEAGELEAVRLSVPDADHALGVTTLDGGRFVLASRRKLVLLDAPTRAVSELHRQEPLLPGFEAVASDASTVAVASGGGSVQLFTLVDGALVPGRKLEPAMRVSVRASGLFVSEAAALATVSSLEDGLLAWDLSRTANQPVARLAIDDAYYVQRSRDGLSLLVSGRGRYVVVDVESLREIASVPVAGLIGAVRLHLYDTGFDVVFNRIGARDVVFVNGATYDSVAVPVPDDVVSLATVPGESYVWALGTRGLWKVGRQEAELWLSAPDDGHPVGILYDAPRGYVLAAWQYVDAVEVEWIDPARPRNERLLGAEVSRGTYYEQAYVIGDRLVLLSLTEDGAALWVELFGLEGVGTDVAPVTLGRFELEQYVGSIVADGRLLLYDTVPDGLPMQASLVDPVALTVVPLGQVPFIGVVATTSASGRFVAWLEGGGQRLQYRLATATLDTTTFQRAFKGPVLPLEGQFAPAIILPRGDGVVLVDRDADRLALAR